MDGDRIRTEARPDCHVCGSAGTPIHTGLVDRLFGVPGAWTLKRCSGGDCGMLWLDPAPVAADLHKAYARYYTHDEGDAEVQAERRRTLRERAKAAYRSARFGFEPSRGGSGDRLLAALLGLAGPGREYLDFGFAQIAGLEKGRLLEIGSGNGYFLSLMQRWGWAAEGLDFDPVAVAGARQKGLCVIQGDLQAQSYADERFDVVFSSHVIEHVADPAALIRESLRVLKPGGRCVVVTPNVLAWSHRLFRGHWRGLEPPRHLNLFTPQALRRLVASCGGERIVLTPSARIAARIFLDSVGSRLGRTSARRQGGRLLGEAAHLVEWALMKTGMAQPNEMICMLHKPCVPPSRSD